MGKTTMLKIDPVYTHQNENKNKLDMDYYTEKGEFRISVSMAYPEFHAINIYLSLEEANKLAWEIFAEIGRIRKKNE